MGCHLLTDNICCVYFIDYVHPKEYYVRAYLDVAFNEFTKMKNYQDFVPYVIVLVAVVVVVVECILDGLECGM